MDLFSLLAPRFGAFRPSWSEYGNCKYFYHHFKNGWNVYVVIGPDRVCFDYANRKPQILLDAVDPYFIEKIDKAISELVSKLPKDSRVTKP